MPVVGHLETTVSDLNPEQMTQTLLSFARSKISPPAAMLNTLIKRIMTKMHTFKPREIAALLTALAHLRGMTPPATTQPDQVMLAAISEQIAVTNKLFTPELLAETIRAYAFLGVRPESRALSALSGRVMGNISGYSAPLAATVFWAVAKLDLTRELGLVHGLMLQLRATVADLQPYAMGLVLWSIHSLGIKDAASALMAGIITTADDKVQWFKGADIAALVHGYALLLLKPPKKHLLALQTRVHQEIAQLSASSLSDLVGGFAELGVTLEGPLGLQLTNCAKATLPSMTPVQMGTIASAFTTMGLPLDQTISPSMARKVLATMPEFDAPSLRGILSAYGSNRVRPDVALLDAIKARCNQVAGTFSLKDAESAILSFTMIGLEPEKEMPPLIYARDALLAAAAKHDKAKAKGAPQRTPSAGPASQHTTSPGTQGATSPEAPPRTASAGTAGRMLSSSPEPGDAPATPEPPSAAAEL